MAGRYEDNKLTTPPFAAVFERLDVPSAFGARKVCNQ